MDPNSQNNNQIYNDPYAPDESDKARLRKLIIIIVGVIIAITIFIVIIAHTSKPHGISQPSKYTKNALAAASKHTANAQVKNLKVAGGFAIAIVSDPAANNQASSGNTTIFKVNKDGSMTQIASGSYFSPLDLLQLGIPLATQAKLTGSSLVQVEDSLANQCGYNDGSIGFEGFDGSFSPGGWQIDSATLGSLEQKLSTVIGNQNASAKPDAEVICVNATQQNSNKTIDQTTYISTFTLQVQFVGNDGTLTTHTVTFAIGPNYYRNYTLDGQSI